MSPLASRASQSGARPADRNPQRGRGAGVLGGLLAAVLLVGGGFWAVQYFQGRHPVIIETCSATLDNQSYSFDPEQMANAALMSRIAQERGLPARATTIAIATAIQESKLKNIQYGDRDSLGLFQQRPSQGWGTPEQVLDPVYSTNKFYDALVKIEGYEQMVITEAAQKVQRSAFPEAYGQHEPDGRAVASALAGYSPGALTCKLRPASQAATPQQMAAAKDGVASAFAVEPAVKAAESELVVRVNGGESQRRQWAIASHFVANAAQWGIEEVRFQHGVWRRDRPGNGWDNAPSTSNGPVATIDGSVAATFARS